MKRLLMWIGGVLFVLIILSLVGIYSSSEKRLNRVYEIPEEKVKIPRNTESVEYGKHIFQFRGCEACHSAGSADTVTSGEFGLQAHLNLPSQDVPLMEGNVYLDDPAVGKVVASNLTSGKGGVGDVYEDMDWVKAIRHGIRPDGSLLLFMPSTEFYFLSDEDLGVVVAYIETAPPVDNVLPLSNVSFVGRIVMTLVPEITFIPAELIPHTAEQPASPKVGVTPEYGEYLTYSCKVCHGLTMSGGKIPGFPANWPPAPNLTQGYGSALPAWDEDGFIITLRTGKTPGGVQLRSEYMPWASYKYMYDDELRAVWVYLQSLPPRDYGNR